MGKIKKIIENELVGGTQTTDVYPVTSIKAVYDESNERLDHVLNRRGIVNISTNYNNDHIAEVLTLSQAINKVPASDRVLGFQGKFLTAEGWQTCMFIGNTINVWSTISNWIIGTEELNFKIVTINRVGGIPKGTNLQGKSVKEILNMMLYGENAGDFN